MPVFSATCIFKHFSFDQLLVCLILGCQIYIFQKTVTVVMSNYVARGCNALP